MGVNGDLLKNKHLVVIRGTAIFITYCIASTQEAGCRYLVVPMATVTYGFYDHSINAEEQILEHHLSGMPVMPGTFSARQCNTKLHIFHRQTVEAD